MAFLLLALLVVASAAAAIAKKHRLSLRIQFAALLWLFVVGTGALPWLMVRGLLRYPALRSVEWKRRNVIVLLGAGTVRRPKSDLVSSNMIAYSRIHEAARLYFDCKSKTPHCSILATGGDPLRNKISEAEVMGRELKEIGVAPVDIILEPKSNNTFQNAQFSSEILRSQPFDKLVLVTSGMHLQRAMKYFAHFHIEAEPAPSDYLTPIPTLIPLGYNFMVADFAFHEVIGAVLVGIYSRLGLNPGSSKPGAP